MKDQAAHEASIRESISRITDANERMKAFREFLLLTRGQEGHPGSVSAQAVAPLPVMSLSELFSMDIPTPAYTIEPVLMRGEGTLLYGPKKNGKSFYASCLCLDAAFGISRGMHKVLEPLRILYIDGEMPIGLINERLSQLTSISGLSDKSLLGNFNIFSAKHSRHTLDVFTSEGLASLFKQVSIVDPDVIVLDNLSNIATGENSNESSPEFSKRINQIIGQLAVHKRERSVLLIHHTGYDESHVRGSSGFYNGVSTSLQITKYEDFDMHSNPRWKILCDADRYKEEGKSYEFSLFPDYYSFTRFEDIALESFDPLDKLDKEGF